MNHRSPWKHEIISPNRLSNRGTPIHKTRHFQKRSLSYLESKDGGGSSFHQPGETVFYSIDAFGEQFHISLEIDHTFISPSFRLDVNSHDRLNSSAFESLRHCFFSGLVNDHHRSYAVFSLCGGLVSTSCEDPWNIMFARTCFTFVRFSKRQPTVDSS